MNILTYLSVAAVTLTGFTAVAAQTGMPKVQKPVDGKNIIIQQLSDNGKWGISETPSDEDGDLRTRGGTIFDMETLAQTPVKHSSGFVGISDITDDGNIVVGECDGVPAYWTKSTGSWTKVTIPNVNIAGDPVDLGRFNSVTPDGHYAAGYFTTTEDPYKAMPMVYDLTTGKSIDLPGMPTLDASHLNRNMNAIRSITPDGRYVIGMLSQSYLKDEDYAPLCTYVYDIQNGTYDIIGFIEHDDKDWEPLAPYLLFVADPAISNNGEWMTGNAYIAEPIPGRDFCNEAAHPFRYNLKTKKFEVFTTTADADIIGFSIGNDGTVYGATPASNPYPNCVVRSGNYFISLPEIFNQVYNWDFEAASGYTVTGKPLSVSNDGRTIIMLPDTEGTYILRMPESLAEAAARVKLLGSYSVSPAEGVKLSRLTTITLTFDRDVKIRGNFSKVTFASEDGKDSWNPVATTGMSADGKRVNITFRSRDLREGQVYTLTIPEGLIRMDGNEEEANEEIVVKYNGRANTPVKPISIIPADGSYVQQLDVTANPIVITFDAELKLKEGMTAELYSNDNDTPLCTLNIGVNGNQAYLFPTAGQYLYAGSEYHILLPAGALTDISGGGANEELTFSYFGTYERQVSADDKYAFSDDCSNFTNLMLYEGDHNQPVSIMAEWDFDKDNTPWTLARDNDDSNMAIASHSMYQPAGQSDDWVVLPQILIPNEKCYLEFLGQSYLYRKTDILDIYVYESDKIYNTMTKEVINDIRTKGELVFHEQLKPGKQEEVLAGDWETYKVPLEKYAKKNVYIAFVNQNKDQSAIFIDDIRVVNDTPFITRFETPERVVDQESVPVSGYILVETEMSTYNKAKLILSDADGNVIDSIEENNLNLSKGTQYDFKFKKDVPLKLGETTTYYVEVTLDNENPSKITGKVANLTFLPKRRIILEEYTGSECGNCPQGIRAMENIEMLYPEVMIPIAIRTYQSDRLGAGMGQYSMELGLDALGAPSAIIDRKEAGYGMIRYEGDYRFSGSGIPNSLGTGDERCWLDIFRTEYEAPAEVGVIHTSALDELKKEANVKVTVINALNKHRSAYKVFAVITEDRLTTYQQNYMSTVDDPDLGEWGKGGAYGKSFVNPVTANHVARQTWGTTFNGTAGFFPAEMKAGWAYTAEFTVKVPETIENLSNCHMVVMVLDENNQVLNANISPLNGASDTVAVDTVAGSESSISGINVINGTLYINADGEFKVNAYDLAGANLVNAKGNGFTSIPLHGYKGILIVKATDAEGNAKSMKFNVR